MKTLFKVDQDGTYTSIQRIECDSIDEYNRKLTKFPDTYFKSFPAAKKAAIEYMTDFLNDWKYAVKSMKAQTKENY